MKQIKRARWAARARRVFALRAAIASALLASGGVAGAQQSIPTRHTREAVTAGQATYLQRMSGTQSLQLNLMLPLRSKSDLLAFLKDIYNPQSASYRQYLSVPEFADRFGPSQQDYNAVVAFAQANGLTVSAVYPNRLVVDVQGPVANIEKAFNINMNVYQHPTENRTFYAPDREPVPANSSIKLWHVAGLDNFSTPRPMNLVHNESAVSNATGSGPNGQFIGSDMRAAYYGVNGPLTGGGQSVGLFEFEGFNIADVNAYFTKVNQPLKTKVVGVSTDGSPVTCTGRCDDAEQDLDIEEAISMAPGMKEVLVYVSLVSDVAIINRMATDNIAKSLSCSWGWSPADPSSDDPLFLEFAAQGQTFFAASGDSGAYRSSSPYVYPADDIYVTSVGGTDLTTNGPGGTWASETAWRSSGGGISPNKIPIPDYQLTPGVITTANGGSLTYRNSPDVAAEGNEDNYICYDGACAGGWGGTSFAAPRWAGYLALVNQKAVTKGKPTIGSLNPTIYSIGLSSTYTSNFHDITSGNNGTYTCQPGYDLVTGWGSPNGNGLIVTLTQ